jgi:hypothetical protein
MIDISLDQLLARQRLPEDRLRLRLSDNEIDDETEVSLKLVGAVNWWKGLELKNDGDQQVAFIEASGRSGTGGPLDYPFDAIEGGWIILWKAKFAGIHTPMYRLAVDDRMLGQKLNFRWTADA